MRIKSNLRNVISLFTMEFFSRLIGFLAVTYLARVLGMESFGLINIGLAILTYVGLAGSAGLNLYGTREVIKNPGETGLIANNVVTTKLLLTIIALLAAAGISFFATAPAMFNIIIAYSAAALPSVFLLEWYFQGRMKMDIISAGRIMGMGVYYIVLLLFVTNPDDAVISGIGWTSGVIVNMIYLYFVFRRSGYTIIFSKKFSISALLKNTFSLGLSTIISNLVSMFPVLFLGIVAGAAETGLYSAAYKLIVLLLVVDRVFSALFFPKITSYYNSSSPLFHSMFNLVLRIINFVGLSVAVLVIIGADVILTLLFGSSYAAAANTFRLLTGVFFFSLTSSAFTFTLIGMNRENIYTISLVYGLLIFLSTVFILGYYFGAAGTAVSYILFQFTSVLVMALKSKAEINFSIMRSIFLPLITTGIIIAGLLMNPGISIYTQLVFTIIIGLPVIAAASGMKVDDLKTIKRAFI